MTIGHKHFNFIHSSKLKQRITDNRTKHKSVITFSCPVSTRFTRWFPLDFWAIQLFVYMGTRLFILNL